VPLRERPSRSSGAPGRRALVAVGTIATLLFGVLAFSPLSTILARGMMVEGRLEPAAVIVVLGGGGVRGDGALTDSSLRRTLHAIDLYRRGLSPSLLFSGSVSAAGGQESEARARLAREIGIPAGAVMTESRARTTREEAALVAGRLLPLGARRILLVADAQGMRRAREVFARAGFEVLAAPADDVPSVALRPEERLLLMRRVLMETLAWLYYRAAGYL
jgi:uncharacterized SAM-binding protein YcdF (DUF218 family)